MVCSLPTEDSVLVFTFFVQNLFLNICFTRALFDENVLRNLSEFGADMRFPVTLFKVMNTCFSLESRTNMQCST